MIVGEKRKFAIELNIREIISERWIYGTYFFWFGGIRLGDPEDSVDLRGCMNWLSSFWEFERVSERYFSMSKREAFIALCADLYVGVPLDISPSEALILKRQLSLDPYALEVGKYSVEYMGMSTFNNVYLRLVDSPDGRQRFIWKQDGGGVEEYILEKNQFREVGLRILSLFEESIR